GGGDRGSGGGASLVSPRAFMGGGGFLGSGSTATQALSADVSRTPKPIGHPARGGRSPCNRTKVATWGWTAMKSAGSSGRRVGRLIRGPFRLAPPGGERDVP